MRKRRATIRLNLKSRDAQDPIGLLKAIEGAFSPNLVEINVDSPLEEEETIDCGIPNEQLETAVREEAAEALDERNDQGLPAPDLKEEREKTRKAIAKKTFFGWRIAVAIVDLAQKVKDLF